MKQNKYSATLNLPKTNFAMRANLAKREADHFQTWHENQLYQKIIELTNDRPVFNLHDGPPYANGSIHLGHAVNKVLKDMIIKSKTLAGYQCRYIPGWDCHGLPIEMKIEKSHGKVGGNLDGGNLDASAFRQLCRQYADEQIAEQKSEFKRLGILGDWENPYQTKHFHVEANEVLALKELYLGGFIRHGLKSVYWSTGCETALAEAELEYKSKQSLAIDVAYAVSNPDQVKDAFAVDSSVANLVTDGISVVIWTTTPWTLPASKAIALNEQINYALCQIQSSANDDRHLDNRRLLIVAQDLASACAERYQCDLKVLATCSGKELAGLSCQHPYLGTPIPIVFGDHVTTDAGTGCVHTAPAHGPEDFELGLKYALELDCPVDSRGHFFDSTPLVGGEFIYKAEKTIIAELKAHQALLCVQKFEHSYPHCWRSKTPVIFRATNQWFISMNDILDKAVDSLESVQFTPSWGKQRMLSMLKDRPDWCISRQRHWGVPITFVTHKETGEMHADIANIIDKVAVKKSVNMELMPGLTPHFAN